MIRTPRILVVDDVAANRLAVRTTLKGVDAELCEADNGFDAVSLCLAEEFALILLDVQMPDMDGFEVCEQLRANPQTSEVPIIFLTAAFREDEDKIHGYLSGATDYLSKPINDRILRSKVKVFLKLYRQQQALIEANAALSLEIEHRKQVEEKLEHQAHTDPLTGILNRRAFFEKAGQELQRLQRYGGNVCMAVLDIDLFKRINDSYGHQVGDEALKLLTTTITSRLRSSDVFARIGGEEFAILLLETSLSEAVNKVEELLALMLATAFVHGSHREQISFSAGVSALAVDDDDIEQAFSRADKLLYQAKDQGRRRVCF